MTVRYLNDAGATVPAPAATHDGDAGPDTREELGRYAEQGGFALNAADNPWLDAAETVTGAEDARAASTVLAELRSLDVRAVGAAVSGIAAKAELDVPDTLLGLGTLLDVLQRVQAASAALRAEAFKADLDALTAATATGRWRKEQGVSISWGRRRALRSEARSLVVGKRPGRADLHATLAAAAAARTDWAALATGDGAPVVPGNAALLAETAQAIETLGSAVRALGRLLPGRDPESLALTELADLVDGLASDEGTLYRLPALAALRTALAGQGLDGLLAELMERQADRDAALAAYDRHAAAGEETADAEEAARHALAAGPRDGGVRTDEEPAAEEPAVEETAAAEVEVAEVEVAEAVETVEAVEDEPAEEPVVEAAAAEAVAEVEVEAEVEAEVETAAEVEAEPVVEAEPETAAEVEAEVETAAEVEAEPVVEVEPEPVVEAVVEVEPEPVAEVEPVVEAEP
ncbi:hypothetical protein, partial [Kitasatospora sp. NPDC059571]|uniref:hypothetical protein n=1 Tax=Kitasatospora sp. NPDC059571 TaxID=3346871 RepID=UPI0036AFF54F